MSATRGPGFLDSSPASADGLRDVTKELSLDRTVSPSGSRRLSLKVNRIEPAQRGTCDCEPGDVEQGRNWRLGEGN